MIDKNYIPDRGDLVWTNFNPQAGHEQAGRRPAVVISPLSYNKKVGLAILCPVTSKIKGYPFEVNIPIGFDITGVILSDQVKNMDWKVRQTSLINKLPQNTILEILKKLDTLIGI